MEEDKGKDDEGDRLEEGCMEDQDNGGSSRMTTTAAAGRGRRRRRSTGCCPGGRHMRLQLLCLEALSNNKAGQGRREGATIERENESNENNGARGGGLNAPMQSVLLGNYQLFFLASSLSLLHPSSL